MIQFIVFMIFGLLLGLIDVNTGGGFMLGGLVCCLLQERVHE